MPCLSEKSLRFAKLDLFVSGGVSPSLPLLDVREYVSGLPLRPFLPDTKISAFAPVAFTFSSANALNVLRTLLGVEGDAKHGDYLESLLARYIHCT